MCVRACVRVHVCIVAFSLIYFKNTDRHMLYVYVNSVFWPLKKDGRATKVYNETDT